MDSSINSTNVTYFSYPIWNNVNAFISVCGTLTNFLVLVLCLKNVCQYSYLWFIASLALGDFLTSTQGIIISKPELLTDDTLCQLAPAVGLAAVGIAIGSRPLLALNRYVAVEWQIWYKPIFENLFIVAACLLINCLLPIAFIVVDYVYGCLKRDTNSKDELVCFFNAASNQIECLLPKMIHFTSCYAIATFCYGKVFLSLRRHQRLVAVSRITTSDLIRNQQLLRLIALHALGPVCLQLPAFAAAILFPGIRQQLHFVDNLILTLAVLVAILDSLLTLFIVKLFRNAIRIGAAKCLWYVRCRCLGEDAFQPETFALNGVSSGARVQGSNSSGQRIVK